MYFTSRLSIEERNSYLEKLRDYLSKYSSKEKWRDDLLKIYNEDGYIRSGDKVSAEFRFLYHDEYLTPNETFIFR